MCFTLRQLAYIMIRHWANFAVQTNFKNRKYKCKKLQFTQMLTATCSE